MESTTNNQGLDRILAVLRAIAACPDGVARLAKISEMTGLSRSTVHRLITSLVQSGLVEHPPEATTYQLGPEMFLLGKVAGRHFGLVPLAEASMIRLAEQTHDTVYLLIRSGDDAVCMARHEGSHPIKTLTLQVNDRRPLGIGAGSLALLAALDDEAVEASLRANMNRISAYPGYSPEFLRELVAKTRADNYALNAGTMLPDMRAIGVPIRDRNGGLAGSLSIAAIESRVRGDRKRELIKLLHQEVESIETKLSNPQNLN